MWTSPIIKHWQPKALCLPVKTYISGIWPEHFLVCKPALPPRPPPHSLLPCTQTSKGVEGKPSKNILARAGPWVYQIWIPSLTWDLHAACDLEHSIKFLQLSCPRRLTMEFIPLDFKDEIWFMVINLSQISIKDREAHSVLLKCQQ